METVFEAMKNALGRGRRIELRRFGVFNVKPRKTGIGRNPRTGQQVNIPPGKAVRFKPGKELQALPAPADNPELRVELCVWHRANSVTQRGSQRFLRCQRVASNLHEIRFAMRCAMANGNGHFAFRWKFSTHLSRRDGVSPAAAEAAPLWPALFLFSLTVLSTLAVGAEFAQSYAQNREPFSGGQDPCR